jgi:hypothetical protein
MDGSHAPELITKDLFTREEWQNTFSPTQVQASSYGVQYVAFDTTSTGFIFSPSEQLAPLTRLDRFSSVVTLQQDKYTGDVYMLTNGQVRLWDPPTSTPYEYTWTSKEFQLSKPESMGVISLKYNIGGYTIDPALLADYTTFNAGRITKPLNSINLAVINGVRTETVAGYVGPQIKNPLGGSPLFNISQYSSIAAAVQANVFARDFDGHWVQVFSYTITDEKPYRMPAGFKSDMWQIQLIGNSDVYSVTMAGTGKELGEA